jgi:hypothetical protein
LSQRFVLVALVLISLLVAAAPAAAGEVTSKQGSGVGSLRQAITDANASVGRDTITFAPSVTGVIALEGSALAISGDTEILGPGAAALTISAGEASQVIVVTPGATVKITGLTLSDGRIEGGSATGGGGEGGTGGGGGTASTATSIGTPGAAGGSGSGAGGTAAPIGGAGISNAGVLTLERVAVTQNHAVGGKTGAVTAKGGQGGTGGTAVGTASTGGKGGAGGNGTAGLGEGGDVLGTGIYNTGSLSMLDSTVSANTANGGPGGDSTAVAGDGGGGGTGVEVGSVGGAGGRGGDATAPGGHGGDVLGAGIYNAGTLTVTDSTVSGNQGQPGPAGTATAKPGKSGVNGGATQGAGGAGGEPGTATAIPGSGGTASGGGIFNATGGSVNVTNSTVAANLAATGANLFAAGSIQVRSTIIAVGVGGADCAGALLSFGYNLESGASCGLGQATDLSNVDPLLGALAANGGETSTMLPSPSSPAIDRGIAGPATDQRGQPRTLDSLGIANAAGGDGTDIGAVELPAQPAIGTAQPPVELPARPAAPPVATATRRCLGKKVTIEGTAKADKIKGTQKADVIAGLAGNDRISGLKGNDLICGEGGKDIILGGPGKDRISGGAGADVLKGGPDKDKLFGGAGQDTQVQ